MADVSQNASLPMSGAKPAASKPASSVGGRKRQFKGIPGKLIKWLTVAFAFYCMLYVGGIFHYIENGLNALNIPISLFIFPLNHDAIFLMFIMAFCFLYFPATSRSSRTSVAWYDWLAIGFAILVNAYIISQSLALSTQPHRLPTPFEQALGVITIILLLEGVRRTAGLGLAIVGLVFFIYPFVTGWMPGFLEGRNQGLPRVVEMLYLFPGGIFGSLLHLMSTLVVVFLIFGSFLQISGAGNFFINLANALMGRFRGGPAKVATVAAALFGMINGSGAANVAAIGPITIPMIKKCGYAPHHAGAILAVASNGGQIMPPVLGLAAFLMVERLGVSYTTIAVAAIVPAVLYYIAAFTMIDLEAYKLGLKGMPKEELPTYRATFKNGWPYIIPIAVLVGLLARGLSPETACLVATLSIVAASWLVKGNQMGWKKITDSLHSGMSTVPDTGVVIIMAGILIGVLDLTGLGVRITGGLVTLAQGNMFLLLLVTAFIAIILGMGMPTSAVYLIVAMLLAPALVQVGMKPLVAHFFVFYYGLAAMLTPPVCPVAFIAAGIAGAPFMKTGWAAMKLGIVVFIVPFIFAFSPELLLIGEPVNIVIAIITAIAGVYLLSAGVEGQFLRETNWPQRVALILGGLLMMVPNYWMTLGGLAIAVIVILTQLKGKKAAPLTPST